MVYGLVSGANRDPAPGTARTSSSSTARRTTTSASPAVRTVASACTSPAASMAVAVEEWLKVIPDFAWSPTTPLMERGGGADDGLLQLPLRGR